VKSIIIKIAACGGGEALLSARIIFSKKIINYGVENHFSFEAQFTKRL
jgi:hypothetical protein